MIFPTKNYPWIGTVLGNPDVDPASNYGRAFELLGMKSIALTGPFVDVEVVIVSLIFFSSDKSPEVQIWRDHRSNKVNTKNDIC